MNKEKPNQHRRTPGVPLENIVVPVILVGGMAGSIALIHRFTDLPLWAALTLGPIGFLCLAFCVMKLIG